MKKEEETMIGLTQSVVKNVLQHQISYNSADSSPYQNSCGAAGVDLDFTLGSYEEIMRLAITKKEAFPEIDFFVESRRLSKEEQQPQLMITFTAHESEVEQLEGRFRSIDISISKSERPDRSNTQQIKIEDYFTSIAFRGGRQAVLRTHYYSEDLQRQFAKGKCLFGCTTLPLRQIAPHTYMVSNQAKITTVVDGGTTAPISFGELSPLVDCKCYFLISSSQGLQGSSLSNSQLAHYLGIEEVDDIKIALKIDDTISIYLETSFRNEQALKQFLIQNYQTLQKIISFDIGRYRLKKMRNFSELPKFFQELSKRMKEVDEHLNLLEASRQKYLDISQQSRPVMVNSWLIYEQLRERLESGGDLLCLEPYWSPQLVEGLMEIYNRWEVERLDLEPTFAPLFAILQHKLCRQFIVGDETTSSLYETVYPSITAAVQLFVQKINFKHYTNSREIAIEKSNPLDDFLMDFIREIDSLNKNEGVVLLYSNKYSVPLKTVIATCDLYRRSSARWADVLNCLTIGFRHSKFGEKEVSQHLGQVEDCRYPSLDCLGCSKFFYYNYTNIISPLKRVPVEVFPLVEKMSDYETQILETICVMLNNRGGVILFNCVREYKQILPRGGLLNEKDKESIENKLFNHMLGFIYPRPEIGSNITVSFVPLACHPLDQPFPPVPQCYKGEEELKPHQVYNQPVYVEGAFVTRIKVCPTDTSKVYLHLIGDDYLLYGISKREKTLAIKKLGQAIKRKFFSHARSQLQRFRDKTFESPLHHRCQMPDSGVIIDCKSTGQDELRSKYLSLEDEFAHMSMLICRSKYLKHIKQRLQGRGVKCEVEVRFSQHKFKSAINTAVLYHDCRLDELVRLLRQQDFIFQDKSVLPIYVTKFVKIEQAESFRLGDVEAAAEWLRMEFPRERLRLFEFRVGRRAEFFLETDSKLSTLFIYYLFQSFGIKVTLKNPLPLDKVDDSLYKVLKELAYIRNHESREQAIRISEALPNDQSEKKTLFSLAESED